MDFQPLLDLLHLEPDGLRWRDVAKIVAGLIDTLLREGGFSEARRLLDPIMKMAGAADGGDLRPQAQELLDRLAGGRAFKRGLTQVRKADEAAFNDLRQMCVGLGTATIPPLAETIAGEEDAKARNRLHGILMDFGNQARVAAGELMRSPNREVRRTAMLLVRELGGAEAIDALEPMLVDSDAKVRHDAMRSMLVIDEARAHGLLLRLVTRDVAARDALTDELSSVRDDRAAPLCGHLVTQLDHRTSTVLYVSAIDALGRLGDPDQVPTLKAALYRGEWWAPVRTRALRVAAAEALRKIGDPAATEVLGEAAHGAPRGVRAVARPEFTRLESGR